MRARGYWLAAFREAQGAPQFLLWGTLHPNYEATAGGFITIKRFYQIVD
jgi:hypothetical protein